MWAQGRGSGAESCGPPRFPWPQSSEDGDSCEAGEGLTHPGCVLTDLTWVWKTLSPRNSCGETLWVQEVCEKAICKESASLERTATLASSTDREVTDGKC